MCVNVDGWVHACLSVHHTTYMCPLLHVYVYVHTFNVCMYVLVHMCRHKGAFVHPL